MVQPPDPTTHLKPNEAASTLRVQAADLEVIEGPDRGRTARVDTPSFVVGTGRGADLRITDETVSREHLRLSLLEDGIRIRDVASTNGSFLGRVRFSDITLSQSTTISIGDTKISLKLEGEHVELPISTNTSFGNAIGQSTAMRHLFALLERAARTEVNVLIEGESGAGKELLAEGLHVHSNRAEGPFVALDCGAIPANLVESELFGHVRGAFTGAEQSRDGAFVQAHGGTIFLDEIGELPLALQPAFLRALETREIKPVGGRTARKVDVRIVAATNKNLQEASRAGEFRRDLFYRLAALRVNVPPLRERREDILLLAHTFLRRAPGFETAEISPEVEAMLLAYAWPGNVRELRNVMQRYAVLGPNPAALFDPDVPKASRGPASPDEELLDMPYHQARATAIDRFEAFYAPALLARAGNVVVRAAALAQVTRGSFHRMLHRIRSSHEEDE